jgi:hypothetical protein
MSLPTAIVNDFYLEVARGNVSGYTAREIVGQNAALAGADKFIWGEGTVSSQDLTEATTAAIVYISSSDQLADVGKAITITGVDANYDEITEVITTHAVDGRTRVAGTKAFLAINKVTVAAALTGKLYVYYLSTVTAGVPNDLTKVQAVIDIGNTESFNAFYCVPRNRTLYLTSLRYRSTGSTTTNDVILSIKRKLYGGAYTVLDVVKYRDLGTTNFIDEQISFTDSPLVFPAKSKFKMTAGLAGGTALNIAIEAKFIEEAITVAPATTTVINKATYLAALTDRETTLNSQNYYLIGLDEVPTALPSSFNLDDTLAVITGAINYRVAADTEVAFDPAYFVSGKLISTTKKALLTVMRCVDSAGNVDYVLAPVNTIVDLGSGVKKTQKINYLAAPLE